jgi:hypothetical protein
MPIKRVLVLANSWKHQLRCVAGREVIDVGAGKYKLGRWVRPVAGSGRGELNLAERSQTNDREAQVFDFVEMPLAAPVGDPLQPEKLDDRWSAFVAKRQPRVSAAGGNLLPGDTARFMVALPSGTCSAAASSGKSPPDGPCQGGGSEAQRGPLRRADRPFTALSLARSSAHCLAVRHSARGVSPLPDGNGGQRQAAGGLSLSRRGI